MTAVNKPYCLDIFQGDTVQGDNDEGFAKTKAAGIAFLDHKASQGTDEVDRMCALRRRAWMDGKPVAVTDVDGTGLSLAPRFGFYHFNGTADASAEATHFIATVKAAGYEVGDDLCLDYEDIGASGHQQPATWADTFCNTVEQWCGFPIKVYGGDAPREQLLKSMPSAMMDRFASRRLWFCQYGQFQAGLPCRCAVERGRPIPVARRRRSMGTRAAHHSGPHRILRQLDRGRDHDRGSALRSVGRWDQRSQPDRRRLGRLAGPAWGARMIRDPYLIAWWHRHRPRAQPRGLRSRIPLAWMVKPMGKVVVHCGMPDEKTRLTAALPPGTLILSGEDKLNLSNLVPRDCTRIISMGLCGGLSPDLKVPDVAIATSVVDRAGSKALTDWNWAHAAADRLTAAKIVGKFVPYYSSGLFDEADETPQRASLYSKYGAKAIDDETRYTVAFAQVRGISFNVVRPLSDAYDDNLPLMARGKIMRPDGSPTWTYLCLCLGPGSRPRLRVHRHRGRALQSITGRADGDGAGSDRGRPHGLGGDDSDNGEVMAIVLPSTSANLLMPRLRLDPVANRGLGPLNDAGRR